MDNGSSGQALALGTMIQEFRITRVLGIGGFGIVYEAENTYFDETVAIKEFFPADLAFRTDKKGVRPLSPKAEESYRWALDRFLKEAKILWDLARPERHPNIVRVSRLLEENGTAYMFMEYEKGVPFSEIMDEQDTLLERELKAILFPLLDGLDRVHVASILHRDIKPANILIRDDGSPVLIDFGSAKRDTGDAGRSVLAAYSPAYAAPEQLYGVGEQGPWTDIYALGATLYRAVTGVTPDPGVARRLQGTPYVSAREKARGTYTQSFLDAIDAALELEIDRRPQSILQWRELFSDDKTRVRRVQEATVLRRASVTPNGPQAPLPPQPRTRATSSGPVRNSAPRRSRTLVWTLLGAPGPDRSYI